MIPLLFFTGILSFLTTVYLVPLFCSIAYKFGILDVPNGAIKRHKKPTPYLGGVAVFLGFIISLAFTFPFERNLLLFFVGMTLLLFLGLIDDLLTLKPYQKFFGQILAAFCFLKAGIHVKEQFFLKSIINTPLSIFWIVLITNAFNLIDVMDGLATTVALSIALSLFIAAFILNTMHVCIVLIAFIGALCAFWLYNKPLARIYLGDAGSLFIGGFLAVMPFLLSWSEFNPYGILIPPCIFAVPLLEIGMLIVIRTYKGIPFYRGSPDHFSHYLQKKGWSSVQILIGSGLFSVGMGALSLLFFLNIIGLVLFLTGASMGAFAWIIFIYKP